MTAANNQRVKQSLERTRLKLKAESIDLEKRRREYGTERADAVAALRILCAVYGDNTWPDELPLAEVLEHHLGGPLAHQLQTAAALLAENQRQLDEIVRRQVAAPQASGRELPRLLPPPGSHELRVIPVAGGRLGQGYRCQCACGWQTGITSSESYAGQLGQDHVTLAARDEERNPRRAAR